MSDDQKRQTPLERILSPRSIAVVGASRKREKIGNVVFRNLSGTFGGKLYAVNSSGEQVEGRKAYGALSQIEDEVDLAVVVVPRDAVPGVMLDAAKRRVKGAVIITSGFREVDDHGAQLESQVRGIAAEAGMRVFGPNTLGLITPALNATFAFSEIPRGKVALVAQSGGLGMYMLEWAQRSHTGISYFVSLGNQADVSEAEVLEFLADDPATGVVFVYLESVGDGRRFLDLVPKATKRKPVIFLKGGFGKKGSEAARTHTGSLAGSADVFRAAVNAVGGMLVENLEDSLNLARLLTGDEAIKPDLLVVTNSGGHGVITADEIERRSLRLAALPEQTVAGLSALLPPQIRPRNPLDLSGDATAERYRAALAEVERLDCTKLVLVQSMPLLSCVEVADTIMGFKGTSVVGVMMGTDEDAAVGVLDAGGVPSFRFPEDAVRAIGHYVARPAARTKVRDARPPEEASRLVSGKRVLTDSDSLRLMEIYGISVPRYGVATTADEAGKLAEGIGCPVVMKISPDEPVHKTELKGVVLDVVDAKQARAAFSELSKITPRVMVQRQVSGLEVFVGGLDDPTFGQTVLVSAGGVYVEVMGTPSHRLAPVAEDEAEEMLRESRVYAMLNARKRGYDRSALVGTMARLSRMMVDLPIAEADLNPVIVNADGAFAVDVRVLLSDV
ncbi:MAG: acetate--CoA ligase family protein [Thaumarchaeota archaeon]|nr:acetate--CoA ligase family protein [Nitrososphaerota archaeon]